MRIQNIKVTVRDLVNGFDSSAHGGVIGYGGQLDIRPSYQREYVYNNEQRMSVIETVTKGFPLGLMYWVDDGNKFELLDGQQRTISLCQYVTNKFSYDGRIFDNLLDEEKEKFLDYELLIYSIKGGEREKLDWFEIINKAGVPLTKQELRNINYTGAWLTNAKRFFSKPNCAAKTIGNPYLTGKYKQQDYLETAIKWISNDNILDYMSLHQHDENANELYAYFEDVIEWVESIFPKYDKVMKGIAWGTLYNEYKDKDLSDVHAQVSTLILDEDVTNHKGIYSYLVTGKERYLNIRAFTPMQKASKYEEQVGICPSCSNAFSIDDMQGDHITPWSLGGMTVQSNLQMLCKQCNRTKSNI